MKLRALLKEDPMTNEALKNVGIDDAIQLLKTAGVLEDPNELADMLGIDEQEFSKLVSRADLLSIDGMGQVYADLLTAAGIKTKSQLGACDPFELHAAIKQVALHTSVGRVPNRATIEHWIEQARK